jgi:hypothetical protein
MALSLSFFGLAVTSCPVRFCLCLCLLPSDFHAAVLFSSRLLIFHFASRADSS